MSVRAYKIKKIASDPSFNCWHDEKIMDIADLSNYSDGGIINIQKEDAEILRDELLAEKKAGKLSDSDEITLDNIKQVIADCDEYGADYYCY